MQLPAWVIADLFKNSMLLADKSVAVETEEDETMTEAMRNYKFLGNDQKKISLLLSSPENTFIADNHLAFLAKMLQAVNMTLADVAILNHHTQSVDITKLKEQLHPRIIILFGLEPRQINLPFNSPAFKIQEYDGCSYLYAPPLEELNRDSEQGKLLKSKLWVCLRKLFEV
jgi:hypothetical protein